jgi:hypothetical protein
MSNTSNIYQHSSEKIEKGSGIPSSDLLPQSSKPDEHTKSGCTPGMRTARATNDTSDQHTKDNY